LHKLASDPSSSIITEIQESERTIQIGFNLKKSIWHNHRQVGGEVSLH
jgi:hypothetical protein